MSDAVLREAERQAAEHPNGMTLSHLAFALKRGGRDEEAFQVALRAVAFDP